MVEATLQPQGRQEGESRRELELSCMSNLLSTAEERVYFKDLMSRFLLSARAGSPRTHQAVPQRS